MTDHGVVLFHTTSAALRAEKVLAKIGASVRLVPTPRDLSSDCGVAVRFDWAQVEAVTAALAQAGLEPAGIHRR